jgi:hypothetical protein
MSLCVEVCLYSYIVRLELDRYRHIFHSNFIIFVCPSNPIPYFDSNFFVFIYNRSNKYENRNNLNIFLIMSDRFHPYLRTSRAQAGGRRHGLDEQAAAFVGAAFSWAWDRWCTQLSAASPPNHGFVLFIPLRRRILPQMLLPFLSDPSRMLVSASSIPVYFLRTHLIFMLILIIYFIKNLKL